MTAETIKQLREARGWTQAELARRLNISRNGVNTWEQGLSMPSPHFLVELAKIFSVSTDFLLGVESLHGNVKKCAVGKHPKSEKLGSTGQAACCARIHSRYFTGGSPSGLRV